MFRNIVIFKVPKTDLTEPLSPKEIIQNVDAVLRLGIQKSCFNVKALKSRFHSFPKGYRPKFHIRTEKWMYRFLPD